MLSLGVLANGDDEVVDVLAELARTRAVPVRHVTHADVPSTRGGLARRDDLVLEAHVKSPLRHELVEIAADLRASRVLVRLEGPGKTAEVDSPTTSAASLTDRSTPRPHRAGGTLEQHPRKAQPGEHVGVGQAGDARADDPNAWVHAPLRRRETAGPVLS